MNTQMKSNVMDKWLTEKLDKMFNVEYTEMEKMLALLDSEHSIVINDQLGLIGEFRDKDKDVTIKDKRLCNMMNAKEKRGDYFTAVGEMGTIIIAEKIEHTVLIEDMDMCKFVFILSDIKVNDSIDTFFDDGTDGEIAVVIYDPYRDSLETNCNQLSYTYNSGIRIEKYKFADSYRLTYNGKEYTSYLLNMSNNISVFVNIAD